MDIGIWDLFGIWDLDLGSFLIDKLRNLINKVYYIHTMNGFQKLEEGGNYDTTYNRFY